MRKVFINNKKHVYHCVNNYNSAQNSKVGSPISGLVSKRNYIN